jgi:hypothetical protein
MTAIKYVAAPVEVLTEDQKAFYASLGPAAGFPPTRAMTSEDSSRLHELALHIHAWHAANESGALKTMKISIRNDRKKRLKEAELNLKYALLIEHGVEEFSWPDGLRVAIIQPPDNSRGTPMPKIKISLA